jgi:hypothetical protein
MKSTTSILSALVGMGMAFALVPAAHAVTSRTWISSAGNDANSASNCPRLTPCRTLAGTYAVTSSGGEIMVLDGGGVGPITVTTPLTISGADGAIIGVASNTVGIIINAGAGNYVVVRNLRISGAGGTNTVGIKLNTGRLILQNSGLRNLTDGLIADSTGNGNSVIRAYLHNNDLNGNTRAITTNGTGTDLAGVNPPRGGKVEVLVYGGSIMGNTVAFQINSPGRNGNGNARFPIFLATGSQVNTNVQGNTTPVVGTPTGVGQDCEFWCQVQTYGPNTGQQDPDPTLSGP